MKKIIAVDMDGTLCEGEAYTEKECLAAVPREDIIEKVNELAQKEFIVILTARTDELLPATMQWLRLNGVRFNAISNNKMPADWYLDDKATNVEDF